jgi:SAM-dependent methyltransferase
LSSPSPEIDASPPPDAPTALTAQRRPHLRQLALQFSALILVLSLAWPYYALRSEELPWPETAFAIGAVALLIATLTRQPWWWRIIHLLFSPLAWGVAELAIDPGWFLLLAILLLLVYRGALSGQVPLYLSNADTATALAELIADRRPLRFLDLGAGVGSVLRPLATTRQDASFTGIENAPATWLAGRLRTAGLANCDWRWGDIWQARLADYDVVYAFLSPAAMPALWQKVETEMPPGSLFISNSFAVPDIEASEIFEVDDGRKTRLYCYRR